MLFLADALVALPLGISRIVAQLRPVLFVAILIEPAVVFRLSWASVSEFVIHAIARPTKAHYAQPVYGVLFAVFWAILSGIVILDFRRDSTGDRRSQNDKRSSLMIPYLNDQLSAATGQEASRFGDPSI